MDAKIRSDYLESVVKNCHESLRLYTLIDDGEQPQSQFFELKMQVVQPQAKNKEDQNLEPSMPVPEPSMPVLEIGKYAQEHVLLMGKAGSGKSTALQQLLLNKAKEAQRNSEALIPVLVKLRSWQSFPSVIALIQDVLETGIQKRLDEKTIIELLFAGRLLLLIDGVNELPSYFQDRNPSNDVEAFRKKYRKTPMIFTTRVLGMSRNLGIAKQMEMLALSDREMRQFIERCLPQQSEQMLNRLGDRLSRLGETPLLLSMLCDISRQREDGLPVNLGSPFREFAEIYDHKIQENIPVDDKYKRWVSELLQQIAFAMMPQNDPHGLQREIPKFEAEKILVKLLYDESRDYAKQCLENLLKYHLIQVNTDQTIKFCHQSIQDYYAAEYLWRQLEELTNEKLQKSYINYWDWTDSLALMLDFEDREHQAVRVVRLALDVDLGLGAKLAGAVEYKFQKKTIEMLIEEIKERKIPKLYEIELLGETRSDYAINSLNNTLQRQDSILHREIIKALGNIGGNRAVSILLDTLKNDYYSIRVLCIDALGKFSSNEIIESLILLLKDSHSFVRGRAAEALGRIGSDKATDALIEVLEDKNKKKSMIEALAKIGSNKAIDFLVKTFENKDLSCLAAEALGKFAGDKATDILIKSLKNEDAFVRERAAQALGQFRSNKTVEALIQALKDPQNNVRELAIEALGQQFGSNEVVDVLLQILHNDADYRMRAKAAASLGKIGSIQAVEPLIQSLNSRYSDVRCKAAAALGEIGSDKAIESLIQVIETQNDYICSISAQSLGKIRSVKAIKCLIQSLKHESSNVRCKSATALGEIGSDDAVDSLIESLELQDSSFCVNVVEALGKIGNKKAINPLIQVLDNEIKTLNYNDSILGQKIAESLRKIASDEDIEFLINYLDDKSCFIRTTATKALGDIGSHKAVEPLVVELQNEDINYVHWVSVEALCKIATTTQNVSTISKQLSQLEKLIPKISEKPMISDVITAIQARCKYYNYEIYDTPLQETDISDITSSGNTIVNIQSEKIYMSDTSKPNISISISGGQIGEFITGDKNVHGDDIGTQNNYYGLDDPKTQELASELVEILQGIVPQISDPTSEAGKEIITAAAMEEIEKKPTLKDRLVAAFKAGAFEAIKKIAKNDFVEVFLTAFKAGLEAKPKK